MIIPPRITGSRRALRGKAFAAGRNGRKAGTGASPTIRLKLGTNDLE